MGPDYHQPEAPLPAAYKELAPEDHVIAKSWKTVEPKDALARGKWWQIYHDQELNSLEDQVTISNQNILAAEASYQAAVATVRESRSNYYPTVSLAPGISYGGQSTNLGNGNSSQGHNYHSDFSAPVEASYLVDVWGSIRRSVEASGDTAQATFAQLENARLSYHAQLAVDYFSLRGIDAQKVLLMGTIAAYEKDLELTRNQYKSGVSSSLDVSLAQGQLETSQAQLADLSIQRGQYEHALATLIGKPASSFSLTPTPLQGVPPAIPLGLPSTLLERRPDIATAERQMAAANAQIGVAVSGYYPTIDLSGSGGFEAYHLAQLFSWPSLAWSVGSSLTQPLFNGGRTHAQVEQARANYEETIANYRSIVLTALQQVEDDLLSLRNLKVEADAQESAVEDAKRAVVITENQYKSGTTSYLNVLTIKISESNSELNAVNVQMRRMVSSVLLIEAIGGGWDVSQLPTPRQVSPLPTNAHSF